LFLGRKVGTLTREGGAVKIAFEKQNGLVPAIIQDHATGEVLMLGFMNEEALAETQRTQHAVFFSRSRNQLWRKGESSGHLLIVREIRVDCDSDAILVRVKPIGPGICHEGYRTCFFRKLGNDGSATVVEERTFTPEDVYGDAKS
jgi:phosphoribosyl-AMP cyclohydrolase